MTSDRTRRAAQYRSALQELSSEAAFDSLVRLAARTVDAPAAMVTLIDGAQLFLFGQRGMPEAWDRRRTLPLAESVCQYPIQEAASFTVEDLHTDPRISPKLRAGLDGLGAYAGTPLIASKGTILGTLAAWSPHPRSWSGDDVEALRTVASSILTKIELRLQVAESVRTDAELEVQRTYFAELFESAPEAIIVVDKDDRIVEVNGEFTRMFGYTAEEAIGRATNDLIAPDELRAEAQDITQRVARGEPVAIETQRRRQDGSRLHVSILCRPIRVDGAAGDADAAYGIYRDITERKRAEKSLRLLAEAGRVLASSLDYEQTLRSLVRLAVPDIADLCHIDMLDENGTVWRVETSHIDPTKRAIAAEIARRFPPTLESANTSSLALREGRPTLMRQVPSSHFKRTAVDSDHLALLHSLDIRSGMTVPLSARGRVFGSISFMITESGRQFDTEDFALAKELARVAGLAVDNAKLYEAALEAGRAKSNFLAIISHELRSPLATVIGHADLLMDGIPEPLPRDVQGYVQRIRDSAWRQAALIEQILSFSRLEGEREELSTERIDAGHFLRERSTLIAARAAEKGLDFEIRVPDAPAWIVTDPSKLTQILLNLLSNAIKFTDAGTVRLSLELTPDEATFRVEDTGLGITPEHMDRVFEPFWQAEDPATRSADGAGLGLAVARRLTRLLGGGLTLESQHGHGTTATLRLPRSLA